VVLRHEKGFLKEFVLKKDVNEALKLRNELQELYIEDSVEMTEREVE
jgi:hypothetical protein